MPRRQVIHVKPGGGSTDVSAPEAFFATTCGHCGRQVSADVVAYTKSSRDGRPSIRWMQCPHCEMGLVKNGARSTLPAATPGEPLEGLPDDVEAAYTEARKCLSVDAFTGCELLCRKILMHAAVDKGAKEGENFTTYIDFLKGAGYTTPPMEAWVDYIRKHGNLATHEIAAPEQQRAAGTLEFTAELLRVIYEMEFKAAKFAPPET
jgi:hypothetical protein